jgi:multidrug efflux pump subunit AcrA (membrane-fusion protein)
VRAPIAGVVTERSVNAGLNVDAATKLFTVVDLSTVWVVAEVYEKDFSRVHVGDTAAITTKAYPETVLRGRVSYIDPQVSPDTRTAKVRVELANPRQALRLGMFADVSIETATVAGSSVLIPRSAVQNVGSRTVVYLADSKQPGQFVEREVRLGDRSGDAVAVLGGVHPGDTIVAEGSFNVRAERDRLGPRIVESDAAAGVQTAKVLVTEEGYEPAKLTLRAGVLARLTFVRTSDKTCGTDVVFPAFGIKRPLPLNEPVVIEFTPRTTGDVGFECGMKMLRGSIVVR